MKETVASLILGQTSIFSLASFQSMRNAAHHVARLGTQSPGLQPDMEFLKDRVVHFIRRDASERRTSWRRRRARQQDRLSCAIGRMSGPHSRVSQGDALPILSMTPASSQRRAEQAPDVRPCLPAHAMRGRTDLPQASPLGWVLRAVGCRGAQPAISQIRLMADFMSRRRVALRSATSRNPSKSSAVSRLLFLFVMVFSFIVVSIESDNVVSNGDIREIYTE